MTEFGFSGYPKVLEFVTGRELKGIIYILEVSYFSGRCLNSGHFCHFKIYVGDAGRYSDFTITIIVRNSITVFQY